MSIALRLAVLSMAIGLLFHGGHLYSVDDETHFLLTKSICESGRLDVAAVFDKPLNAAIGRGGLLYPYYAPATSLVGVPFYLVGKALAVVTGLSSEYLPRAAFSLQGLLWGAFLAAVVYRAVRRIGATAGTAIAVTLVQCFATYSFGLSRMMTTNLPVGVCYLAAWTTMLDSDRPFQRGFLAGAALSAALLYRYDSILFWPLLFLGAWPRAVAMAVGVVPGIAVAGVYNWYRFGSIFSTGAPDLVNMFSGDFVEGLLGLTVMPSRGLLWYSALSAASAAGVLHLKPQFRRPAIIALVIMLIHLAMVSSHAVWNGGACWGPRHLGSVLPLLAVGLVPLWDRSKRWVKIAGVAGAVCAQLLGAAVSTDSWNDLLWDHGITYEVSWSTFQYNPWFGQAEVIKRVEFERLPREYRSSDRLVPVGATPPNQALRRSLDFWWIYAWKMGVPPLVLAPFLLILVIGAWFCARWVRMGLLPAAGKATSRVPPTIESRKNQ